MTNHTAQQLRILSSALKGKASRFDRRQARQLQRVADGMEHSARFAVLVECCLAQLYETETGKPYNGCEGRFIDWLLSLDWEKIGKWVRLFLSILVLFL